MSDAPTQPALSQYDTPVGRATIEAIPIDELDRWLETVRARRIEQAERVARLHEARQSALHEAAREKFDREMARVRSAMTKVDEAIHTIEVRINKLRVLEMEMTL